MLHTFGHGLTERLQRALESLLKKRLGSQDGAAAWQRLNGRICQHCRDAGVRAPTMGLDTVKLTANERRDMMQVLMCICCVNASVSCARD